MVRRLIEYGANLAITLRQRARASADDTASLTRPFGTSDIALILARITRGLLLASALQVRLISHPLRETAPQRPAPASPPAAPPRAARPAVRRARDTDPRLTAMPTAEEIAAEIRRRPIGAVLADICRDLGVTPTHVLWREVSAIIAAHGGTTTRLFNQFCDRLRQQVTDGIAFVPPTLRAPAPPAVAACGTGPP
jgi:hypothetical protein